MFGGSREGSIVIAGATIDADGRAIFDLDIVGIGSVPVLVDTGFNRDLYLLDRSLLLRAPHAITVFSSEYVPSPKVSTAGKDVFCDVASLRLTSWLGKSDLLAYVLVPRMTAGERLPRPPSEEMGFRPPQLLLGMGLLAGGELIVRAERKLGLRGGEDFAGTFEFR